MIFLKIFILLILVTAAWAGISAAPWVPTRRKDVKRTLDLAQVKPGEKVYDLGSGDGRLIIAAARDYQAQAIGLEISLFQYLHSRLNLLFSGLKNKSQVKIKYRNFFRYDISEADVVIVFLLQKCYPRLVKKLAKELKPGARVVVHVWPLKEWKPVKVDRPTRKDISLYLYKKS